MNPTNHHPDYAKNEAITIEKDISLRDYLRILSDRRSVVYTVFTIVMILTVISTFSKTPMYEASAKLLVEQNQNNPLASELDHLGRDPEFLATQTEIIKSSAVGMKVVEMLNLDSTYDKYFEDQESGFSLLKLRRNLTNWLTDVVSDGMKIIGISEAKSAGNNSESEDEKVTAAEEIAEKLSSEITVRPINDSRIITLNYLSPNPVLASKIVNSVASAYIEKTFDMKMESSSYTLQWMTEKANEEKANLERAERALQKYMEDNDIVTIENRVTVIPQKLAEINNQVIQIQGDLKELELLYNRIKALPENLDGAESLQVIADDEAIQSLRSQILQIERNIMDLTMKGPNHPGLDALRNELEILVEQRRREITRVTEAVRNEYELVRAREHEYTKLLKKTKQEAVNLHEKFIQYNMLERESETSRQLYNTLITRIKEQNLADQAQSVKVWVVEKAKTPKLPATPDKARNILVGIVLALFFGFGSALFLDHLDNTVKYSEDLERRLDLPVLGNVVKMTSKRSVPEKEVLENALGPFSECFKNIQTTLMLSSAGPPPKTLLISSMTPEEGKTTSTVSLAVSMAQAGKRVLLIDADMRRPRIHDIFNLPNEKGLSSYLSGTADTDYIQKTQEENLDVVTSGPIPPNPIGLLISEQTQKLITRMEVNYDMILFDSPPILTVSDGLILGKVVAGIILIARMGKTTYELLEKGKRKLANIDAKVNGVILNAVNLNKSEYYQYYSYRYTPHHKK